MNSQGMEKSGDVAKIVKSEHDASRKVIDQKCDVTDQKNNSTGQKVDVTETTGENGEMPTPTPPGGMSKNQIKKMIKRQRWLDQKHSGERRAFERQKKKDKRQARKELGEPLPPSRKRLKKNTMKNSACKVKVAIDCSFDSLMSEKDICQLVQQLNHAYAANRRVEDPMQFYITSLSGQAKKRLDDLGDYKNWDVYTQEEDYLEDFRKDQIVYLTSESPNVLSTLEEDKVYIIGGLVDHNHQKGLCYRLAQEKGIAHAQLPISDYIQLKTRKVLTINHVFEILVQFTQTNSWEEAFFKVIPNRKMGAKKSGDKDKKASQLSDEDSKPADVAAGNVEQTESNINIITGTSCSAECQPAQGGATYSQTNSTNLNHQGAAPSDNKDCQTEPGAS